MPPDESTGIIVDGAFRSGGLTAAWEAAQNLAPAERAVYLPVLLAFRSLADGKAAPEAVSGAPDATRVAAFRTAMLALDLETGTPTWSSDLLERLVAAVGAVPDARIDDLFRAVWEMLGAGEGTLNRVLANFLKDLVRTALSAGDEVRASARLDWLAAPPGPVNEARAFFLYFALALRPPLFSPELDRMVRARLASSPFLDEVT